MISRHSDRPADQPAAQHSEHRAATVAREVRCGNRGCPSARRGRPALICIVDAPGHVPLVVRTRCRRCKTFQRIDLPAGGLG